MLHMNAVRALTALIAIVLAIALASCKTRSISNSAHRYGYGDDTMYTGELSEFSVIGIDPNQSITDEQIAEAFASSGKLQLKEGNAILLIQSGASFPDEPMQSEPAKTFRVVPFSSATSAEASKQNVSKALRLAAAQGGCDFVVCYWGILETARKDLITKGVSWVPVVGRAVPDESQEMRIRLKMVIVDARTGAWIMLAPEPFADTAASARVNRESSDQSQVYLLKEKAYTALANHVRQMAASS